VVFLINANLGSDVAEVVRQHGHDAIIVTETYPPRTPDAQLIADAKKYGWIIITRDKGFSQYAYREKVSGYGIITLRLQSQDTWHICARVSAVLDSDADWMNTSVVVTDSEIRGLS
jgi:predicted nuclease of predicted toxin-antitoxin system